MELTKENLEELRKDPLMRFIASTFGEDLDKLVDNSLKEIEEKERAEQIKNTSEESLKKAKDAQATINDIKKALEHAGFKEFKEEQQKQKKEYEAPKVETHSFIMSKEQFVQFCKQYSDLINHLSKLRYIYGISFDDASAQFNFEHAVSTIVWDFVRLIFGDDNADDIADFLYGNSNFDSAEELYEELV